MSEEKLYTSLGQIVEAQDAPSLKKYLDKTSPKSQDKSDLDAFNETINQLFWHSSKFDNAEIVQLLIDKGANINYIQNGKKAIHNAISESKEEVLKVLIKNKVNIDEPDPQGNSGFILLFDNEELEIKGEWGQQPEKNEATEKVLEMAEKLLKLNANVDAQNLAGKTALHYAAYHGNMYLAQLLTKNNANPNLEAITDSCIAAEYVSEENQELFDYLENYRNQYATSAGNNKKFKI